MPRDLDALPRRGGFRLRGLEMTRLESFVDATFAFAVSLLVVAGQQVPDDLGTLLRAFNNVPAFAASIAVMGFFWRGHWLWSRRFGLEDGVSILISWAMIFTIRSGNRRHRARDRAPLLACMAIARAFAIEQRGTIHDSRRDHGLVHSYQRRLSLAHPGADFACRPDLMVRLGLLFHVLFVSR
jgi:Endosomal/lysosomal potassium channel TMEM175